jgi:hypothetical protein
MLAGHKELHQLSDLEKGWQIWMNPKKTYREGNTVKDTQEADVGDYWKNLTCKWKVKLEVSE